MRLSYMTDTNNPTFAANHTNGYHTHISLFPVFSVSNNQLAHDKENI